MFKKKCYMGDCVAKGKSGCVCLGAPGDPTDCYCCGDDCQPAKLNWNRVGELVKVGDHMAFTLGSRIDICAKDKDLRTVALVLSGGFAHQIVIPDGREEEKVTLYMENRLVSDIFKELGLSYVDK